MAGKSGALSSRAFRTISRFTYADSWPDSEGESVLPAPLEPQADHERQPMRSFRRGLPYSSDVLQSGAARLTAIPPKRFRATRGFASLVAARIGISTESVDVIVAASRCLALYPPEAADYPSVRLSHAVRDFFPSGILSACASIRAMAALDSGRFFFSACQCR